MTHEEKSQIKKTLVELRSIQEVAPSKTTYRAGRTEAAMSYRLLSVIADLEKVISNGSSSTNGKR